MTRLRADIALFFVALIWGVAFLFQKQGVLTVGVFTFVAARFLISALVILPLVLKEFRAIPEITPYVRNNLIGLCVSFILGVMFQHLGLLVTSVTSAGFLTGLYVLFVALICRFVFDEAVSKFIFPAALISVIGVALLSGGGDLGKLNWGDGMVVLCAVAFGFQVAFVGRVMKVFPAGYYVSFLQYVTVTLVCVVLSVSFEHPQWTTVWAARWDLLYAGALSGGVAYTLQVKAQQYTPASDSAVIMSLESLFAAIFGVWINGDAFTSKIALGAALILIAIALVEFGPKDKFHEHRNG